MFEKCFLKHALGKKGLHVDTSVEGRYFCKMAGETFLCHCFFFEKMLYCKSSCCENLDIAAL